MNPEVPPTNMAFFDILDSNPITIYQIEAELKKRGVLAGAMGSRRFRFVTHYQITDADVEQTIAAMKEILR